MEKIDIGNVLLGILTTIALSLSGFALKWQFDANAEIKLLNEKITRIENDKTLDESQSSQISKFWRLHAWERTQIEDLRFRAGLPPAGWPDLGGSD